MLTARLVAIAAAALTLSTSLAAQTEEAAKPEAEATSEAAAAEASTPAEAATEAATAETSGTAEAGPVTAASPSDFRTGMEVRDARGGMVGTVESVDGEGAIVFTGNLRAKLPFQSFGKNNLGLVISLSRAELEAAASAQRPG